MPKLTLYYFDSCPFCQRVLRYLQDNNIEIPLKNILEKPENRQELMDIAGDTQVPCLVIDGKALHESADIIEWFKTNWKKG